MTETDADDVFRDLWVGPYRLLAELGRGGMGRVFRARHTTSQVDVALKTVVSRSTKVSADVVARLLEEVRVVAQLRHPGVVEILDYGRLDASSSGPLNAFAGCPFIVMELAPNGSLAPLRGTLGFQEVTQVADQLLRSLAHAHAHGILHCDVKLANVLRAGPRHRLSDLRLADFGVAAYYTGPQGPRYKGGTRAYMPPEQMAGEVRMMGPWSDLFSLAKTLAELLAPDTAVPDGFATWLETCLAASWRHRFRCCADARAELLTLNVTGAHRPWRGTELSTEEDSTTSETTADSSASAPLSRRAVHRAARGVEVGTGGVEQAPPRAPRPPAEVALEPAPPRMFLEDAGASLAVLRPPPLLGRQRERRLLWQALETAAEQCMPEVVLLEGPDGIGKSRLAEWMVQRAEELGAGHGLRAEHGDEGKTLVEMVRRDLRAGGLSGSRLHEHVAVVAPEVSPELTNLLEPKVSLADAEAVPLVADYLIERSMARPVVLLLEGAPDAREAQALVTELLARRRGAILVLCIGRQFSPTELAPWAQLDRFERLRLGPLSKAETVKLVQSLCRLDAPTAGELAVRVGGHPGHACQLVRFWLERQSRSPETASLRLDELPLPQGLNEIQRERLEHMLGLAPPGVQEAIELAAAGGQRVTRARWAAACEAAGVSRSARTRAEELLVAGGHVRRSSLKRKLGLDDWHFEQPAFREAVLTAAGARRQAWHRRYAALATSAEARGTHAYHAGDFTEAFEALVDAADEQWKEGAQSRAFSSIQRALEALAASSVPPDHASRGRYLRLRGRGAFAFGRADEAACLADEALRWGERYGRAADEVDALLLRADIEARTGAVHDASFTLEEAQRLSLEHHLSHRWAQALLAWAEVGCLVPGMTTSMDRHLTEAMTLAVVRAHREVEAMVLLARAHVELQSAHLDGAEAAAEACLHRLPSASLGATRAGWLLGCVARERGNLDDAVTRLERALAALQSHGAEPAMLWACRADLARVHNRRGDYTTTRNLVEAGPATLDRRHARPLANLLRIILLPVYAAFGAWSRWDETLHAAASAVTPSADAAAEAERAGDEAQVAGQMARAHAAYTLADKHLFSLGRQEDLGRVLAKRRALPHHDA